MSRWVFVLCALFVLAGCTPGGPPESPTELTGQEGVVISAVQVPDVVYPEEEFTLTYELENRGRADVSEQNPGRVFVSHDRLYLEYLDVTSGFGSSDAFALEGRTLYADGERGYVNLHFRARPIDRFSEKQVTTVRATACYPYATNVTVQACIEQNRNVDPGAVACRNAPVRPASPAAPIGVEEVIVRTGRQQVQGQQVLVPQFRITLRNYGDGIPSVTSCDSEDTSLLNTVGVSASILNEELDCTTTEGQGIARLSRGEAMVTCTLFESSRTVFPSTRGNFVSLLSLDLDYTYRDSVSSEVEVRR